MCGYAREHIPSNKGYDWGVGIFSKTINQVPNLGLSPGAYFGLDPLQHDPGKWVTNAANPFKWVQNAGGYGYAVGAEWTSTSACPASSWA